MRIAIVNDMPLAQAVLKRVVESAPGYRVAWTALDGAEAVQKAAADLPDVILMDLVMPVLDGAAATRRIMAATPCPILIVTSSVGGNFAKVYEALGAGGLDALKTPTFADDGSIKGGQALLDRLALLAQARGRTSVLDLAALKKQPAAACRAPLPPMLAIGASTGGPEAVAQVLAGLGGKLPGPAVVVQHIAADFAGGLAVWLQSRTGLRVETARAGAAPQSGCVHVAASNDHLVLGPDRRFIYTAEPRAYPYRPSVDVFFESLTSAWPSPGIAVLLTGMGRDGARGLADLRTAGWHTVAEAQSTCVVFGMPRAAVELNAAVETLPLPDIGPALRSRLR
jgi:two-component system response regulator WspF